MTSIDTWRDKKVFVMVLLSIANRFISFHATQLYCVGWFSIPIDDRDKKLYTTIGVTNFLMLIVGFRSRYR